MAPCPVQQFLAIRPCRGSCVCPHDVVLNHVVLPVLVKDGLFGAVDDVVRDEAGPHVRDIDAIGARVVDRVAPDREPGTRLSAGNHNRGRGGRRRVELGVSRSRIMDDIAFHLAARDRARRGDTYSGHDRALSLARVTDQDVALNNVVGMRLPVVIVIRDLDGVMSESVNQVVGHDAPRPDPALDPAGGRVGDIVPHDDEVRANQLDCRPHRVARGVIGNDAPEDTAAVDRMVPGAFKQVPKDRDVLAEPGAAAREPLILLSAPQRLEAIPLDQKAGRTPEEDGVVPAAAPDRIPVR